MDKKNLSRLYCPTLWNLFVYSTIQESRLWTIPRFCNLPVGIKFASCYRYTSALLIRLGRHSLGDVNRVLSLLRAAIVQICQPSIFPFVPRRNLPVMIKFDSAYLMAYWYFFSLYRVVRLHLFLSKRRCSEEVCPIWNCSGG